MNSPDGPNMDPALLDLFRAEMDAHIPVLSQGLLALEKGRAGEQDIAAMMRAAHSIKGAARIVGIDAAVRVAHVIEDCFSAAKEARTPLVGAAVDVLLQGVDALQRICALEPDPELTDAWLAALHERIAAVRDGRLPTVGASQPATSPGPADAAPLTVHPRPTAELRLTLPADFNDAAAEELRARMCAALDQETPRICLDFSPVRRISAGALALLAVLVRETARLEPAPVLTADGVVGPVATLLRVTGLDRAWKPNG
jgi:chemotaxis protein histidine kinase CheA